MYSQKIQEILKSEGIKVGDRVIIEKSGKEYHGLFMPRAEFGDSDSVVIKLDSGYNIGIKYESGVKIRRAKEKEPKEIKEEEEFELGRVNKKLLTVNFDPKKPKVSMISTGGTITSRIDYRTGGVYTLEKPEELLHNIPELSNIANLKMLNPINRMSEDIGPKDWQEIAKHVADELNSGKKGVVVTHGTDTLHYTSAALSFMLRNVTKPVILTGAQKSSDRGSSDAGINIICSTHLAINDIAEVGTCMHGSMNDDYCFFIRGTKVRKMHTSRRDAFRPINEPALAKIWPNGKIEILNKNHKKRSEGQVELDIKFEPKVAILKAYPGSDPEIIELLVKKGYKGFVIEGTGLGHVPTPAAEKSWTETIKKHTKNGIPFVVAPQPIYGRVNPYVYTNLRILYMEAGAIPGEDMLSEVAYIKLGWVLGHTTDFEKVKKMMLTNYAGEITPRTELNTFSVDNLNE
jgi:glutamyl-tRNA(Gln) amidotransferase subunit D